MSLSAQKKSLTIAILSCLFVVTGCGSNNPQNNSQNNAPNNQNATGNKGTNADDKKPLARAALVKAGTTEKFMDYYKTGINNNRKMTTMNVGGANAIPAGATPPVAPTATPTPTTARTPKPATPATTKATVSKDASAGFGTSTTNLIESGVDEVDFVKQNATHIYTTSRGLSNATSQSTNINVFKKPNTTKAGSLEIKNDYVEGLFLAGKNLISVGSKYNSPIRSRRPVPEITLNLINVSNDSDPNISKNYTWDGAHKASRRIGNHVYVISNSYLVDTPVCLAVRDGKADVTAVNQSLGGTVKTSLPGPGYCQQPEKLTIETLKERMPVGADGKRVDPADCLIPNAYKKDADGINTNVTLVTKIDIEQKKAPETLCIAASAEHVYMSPESLYLTGYDYNHRYDSQKTLINKFVINDTGVSYQATGKVDGHINWTAPSFSMNEHKGILRIATTKYDNGKIINMVHTMKSSSSEAGALDTIATIPNAQNPKAIGKPGERIQGIRFLGDIGFVVTFKNTDPLYKIDLKDPAKPSIKGELQMPGYSAYLHPITDKYLLGVGYSAKEDKGRTQITGLQTTLFDVSADNPVIVSQDTISPEVKSWFNLPVARDSRAITTVSNDTQTRVAIPYRVTGMFENGKASRYIDQDKAVEYVIDKSNGNLLKTAERLFEKDKYYSDKRRALIDNDDIYYNLESGKLSKHLWGKND